MAEQATSRRRGNPNWTKGGPSPNPNGRPRTGQALAETIRVKVDPAEWVDFELAVARDTKQPIEKRAAAWHALVDRGFPKPAQTLLTGDASEPEPDLSAFTTDELAQWIALRDKAQRSAGSAVDQRLPEPPVTDDDHAGDTLTGTHAPATPRNPEAA